VEKPKILTTEILFNGYFNVQQDLIERADGRKLPYSHCVLPSDAAVVIGETPNGQFVLNREYRHPTGSYLIGCAGGSLKEGEDPILGGLREFHEETGYWSDELILLGTVYPMPSICSQKIYFLWARNAYPKGPQELDPFEYIQTELKTEKELQAEPGILDGLLLTALSLRRWKYTQVHSNLGR